MVLWLDEIQHYFGGQQGLAAGVLRELLNAPDPVVIVATLWPDRYADYTALPAHGMDDGDDRYSRERQLLGLADVIRISPDFTEAETARARAASIGDRRLQVALGSPDYGLTQILAGGPQLVERWEDAKTAAPHAWAVLTAALDAARLGARAPLSAGLLRSAAQDYSTPEQKADASGDWFDKAREYATKKLHGATAPLRPFGDEMGKTAGYTVADYLLQHAIRIRRTEPVPASTWNALLEHIQAPGDARRLGHSAASRLLYLYAIPFYRRAIDAGDHDAAYDLADLLVRCGDVDGLRALADAGTGPAVNRLDAMLAERGEIDELRARADSGDTRAEDLLIRELAERGDLDALRVRADAGDSRAADRLDRILAERGEADELRVRADNGDSRALGHLVNLLTRRGELDATIQALRQHPEAGSHLRLARLLAQQGDLDELRACSEAGDVVATRLLARMLGERGELDEAIQIARELASTGDDLAVRRLDELLAERGDIDELRARAKAGDGQAARLLAQMLGQRGNLGELRARAKAGEPYAARSLAEVLAERGDLGELGTRADAGDSAAADRLARVLAERGDLGELRARADAGDSAAADRLARVLAERGDLGELRARADAGDSTAAHQLVTALAERGDLDGLRARAEAGDWSASWLFVDLLIKSDRSHEAIEILRVLAPTHSDGAASLARLLGKHGYLDELRARTEAGDQYAAHVLADALAQRGELDELRSRVNSGDSHAAELFADLLAQRSTAEDAMRLRRFGLNADGSIASSPSS